MNNRPYPSLYTDRTFASLCRQNDQRKITIGDQDFWVLARPKGYPSFWYRIKLAWMVLTGKADAMTWPGEQEASNG